MILAGRVEWLYKRAGTLRGCVDASWLALVNWQGPIRQQTEVFGGCITQFAPVSHSQRGSLGTFGFFSIKSN
jgi:hypothetical protein